MTVVAEGDRSTEVSRRVAVTVISLSSVGAAGSVWAAASSSNQNEQVADRIADDRVITIILLVLIES
jgi:hypothetical protein